MIGGILLIPFIEIELILISIVGTTTALSIGSILSTLLVPVSSAIKEANKDGKDFFYKVLQINNQHASQMNFFCYSFGSAFVISCLKQSINNNTNLFVRNLIVIGGVSCQSEIIANIDKLIGIEGMVLGRIIIVSCKHDVFNRIVIKYMFRKKPLGYDNFNYIAATNKLMLQSNIFRNRGYKRTMLHIRDKIKQVDVSHFVKGHSDYKSHFRQILRTVYRHFV